MKKGLMITGKSCRLSIHSILAALMLVVYSTGAISIDLVHHILHDHAQPALHTGELEKNACHRALYHQDKENGCSHQAHITNAEKCKYNHIVFQPNQLITPQAITRSVFEDHFAFSFYRFTVCETNLFSEFLRGPPAV
jgi:hypothetical protein